MCPVIGCPPTKSCIEAEPSTFTNDPETFSFNLVLSIVSDIAVKVKTSLWTFSTVRHIPSIEIL